MRCVVIWLVNPMKIWIDCLCIDKFYVNWVSIMTGLMLSNNYDDT